MKSKKIQKNVFNKTLKICSKKPLTGYLRNGYCENNEYDNGKHLVCAIMDDEFLNFSKSKGNDLTSIVKSGDKWCLCENRFYQAYLEGKNPVVLKDATHKNVKKTIKKTFMGGKKTKKQFLYNPDDPKKSFDVYIDKDPTDTIPIKYTTIEDVKKTIKNLETLYKQNKYPHKRIWQVGMIMKVRLEAMLKHKNDLYPNAKNVIRRFILANKYFLFLRSRTKEKNENKRKKMRFNI